MNKYEHGGNIWVKNNPQEWLDFSANINPYGPPQVIKQIIQNKINQINAYPEPLARLARVELARYLNVDFNEVLLTSGGISAMELVIRTIKPQHSLIIQPGFVEYERLSSIYSTSFENIVAFTEKGYSVNIANIENKLKKADLLFLCHPSNPVGLTLNENTLQQLFTLCEQNNVTLVLDEAFIHYCIEKTKVSQINSFNNLIIVGSLTKIYSIPGIRAGYIVANKHILKRIEQQYLPWSVNIFAQEIVKALNLPQIKQFEQISVKKNAKAKALMVKELTKLGFKVYNSLTNYLLLQTTQLGLTSSQINHGLINYKVMVRDCSNFVGLNNNYIRVAVKKIEQNNYLINSLKEVIKCGTYFDTPKQS
ncbi:histidinol-phosphate aminotransferase family protein [Clostridium sp. 'deep sea']|uniref:pyridoxal phosphate-dependent aminotransferase n=1 Tax=Clostridium sp. 'deep sea' TaxID=2779445 RepID=UPI00189667A3|nr:histidinol-phosphate transaminase [Clostridium sp. 'deep sea']QOR34739.1 histidinol-phosphate aminotransferase family protein [Clostridium sp. 'deep sea']